MVNQHKRYYHIFREVSRLVHSKTRIKEVMELVVSKATEGLNAKGAVLCILNKETNKFEIRSAYGMAEAYLGKKPMANNDKLMGWPAQKNTVHIINDIWNNTRVKYPQEAWDEGVRSMIDVPLCVEGQVTGFIRIFLAKKRDFPNEELDFMMSLAEQCACAIEHADEMRAQKMQYSHLATKIDKMSSLGRMAAGIAHEINNPLTGILLYSSSMRKKAPDEGPFKDGLKIIMDETKRCKTIIKGLLEFARDNKPEKSLTNINQVIDKAFNILDNEFHINHIDVTKDLYENIRDIPLDANQIEQVLINLLLNAIHSIEQNGQITITSREDCAGNKIIVEISDNGCGIPQEQLKKIFEPFFSTKVNGTGLGLAVSYGIVRSHHGNVHILSEVGKGSTFIIDFPIACDSIE